MPKNLLNSISDSRTPDPSLDELEIPIKRIPINADLALIKILTIENRDKEIEYIYEELKARYMREDIYSNEFRADHRKEVHSIVKEEFTPTTVKEKLRDSIKYLIVLEVNEKYPNSKLSKEILLECIPKLIKKLFIYIHEDVPDNDDDDRFSGIRKTFSDNILVRTLIAHMRHSITDYDKQSFEGDKSHPDDIYELVYNRDDIRKRYNAYCLDILAGGIIELNDRREYTRVKDQEHDTWIVMYRDKITNSFNTLSHEITQEDSNENILKAIESSQATE